MGILINKKITTKKVVKLKEEKLNYRNDNSENNFSTLEALIKNIEYDDVENVSVTLNNETIGFSASDLPHCCGIYEIGDLYASKNVNISTLSKFLDLYVNLWENYTLIINTNGISYSTIFEKALAKCDNWIAVKSFKNRGSGNTITMWISKNE